MVPSAFKSKFFLLFFVGFLGIIAFAQTIFAEHGVSLIAQNQSVSEGNSIVLTVTAPFQIEKIQIHEGNSKQTGDVGCSLGAFSCSATFTDDLGTHTYIAFVWKVGGDVFGAEADNSVTVTVTPAA
ncbi:MAG: hypothetical protein HYV77_02665, partial [Candidatus Wildermuthbacteria bacterium]|nr:hypothetical protein [Candidatus Wildermuthbacteria bacterium]